MSKINGLNLKMDISLISVMTTCFVIALLTVEVGTSPYSSKSVSFLGESALNRVRREDKVAAPKSSLAPEGSEQGPEAKDSIPRGDDVKPTPQPNCSDSQNGTKCIKEDGYIKKLVEQMSENKGMLWRTLCVSLGVTGIVVIYFVVRAVRLRRRRSKSRKYGIITQHDHGDVEMEPLGDGNDDDDDYTVFEMNGKR